MYPITYPNGPCRGDAARPPQPKLELQPVDLDTWDDGKWGSPSYARMHPFELGEPWPYRFESGDSVWLFAGEGDWYLGKVVGQPRKGKTRSDEGLFWCVEFVLGSTRVRKWVAPLNGEVKADDQYVRHLLTEAGWLERPKPRWMNYD